MLRKAPEADTFRCLRGGVSGDGAAAAAAAAAAAVAGTDTARVSAMRS